MSIYNEIDAAKNSIALGRAVEDYLKRIEEYDTSRDESYEDTANRLRRAGMDDEANILFLAAEKWWEVEQ